MVLSLSLLSCESSVSVKKSLIEKKKELPNITILDAMIVLEESLSTLPDITVANRFRKVGI